MIANSIKQYREYIASQTLARSVSLVTGPTLREANPVEIDDSVITYVWVSKI